MSLPRVLFLQLKYGSLKVWLKVFAYLRNTKYKKNTLQYTLLKYFRFIELKYKIQIQIVFWKCISNTFIFDTTQLWLHIRFSELLFQAASLHNTEFPWFLAKVQMFTRILEKSHVCCCELQLKLSSDFIKINVFKKILFYSLLIE